jgi:predicted dehydrogenase
VTFATHKTARVLLIGVGYFARRLYVPYFMEHNQNSAISLVCGLDLSSQKEIISNHLQSKQYKLPVYYTNENESHTQVSDKLEHLLDMIVTKHKINCVVISTEPLSHAKYAKFALSRGLNILLDKPITAHSDVVNSMEKAKCIYQDYIDIKTMYLKAQKLNPNLVFNVMAQRRFHPAFQFGQKMLLGC